MDRALAFSQLRDIYLSSLTSATPIGRYLEIMMCELCPSEETPVQNGEMTVYSWEAYASPYVLVVDKSDNSVGLIDRSKLPGDEGYVELTEVTPYAGDDTDPLRTCLFSPHDVKTGGRGPYASS